MNNITMTFNEVPLNKALEMAEKEVYRFGMQLARYNQSKAAKLIGVSRGTLRTKLDLYFPGEYLEHKGE